MRVNENEESSVIGNKAVDLRNKSISILQPINGNSYVRDDTSENQNTKKVCEDSMITKNLSSVSMRQVSPKQISTKSSKKVLKR